MIGFRACGGDCQPSSRAACRALRNGYVLAFGLPMRGKTHVIAAPRARVILRHGKRVLFRQAFKLVGQPLAAKRDLRLEAYDHQNRPLGREKPSGSAMDGLT